MPLQTPGLPPWIVNWARPGKLLAANGVTLKQMNHAAYTVQTIAENGDRIQLSFICAGNETRLLLSTNKYAARGIFDLYVNNVLDSMGYDDYAASGIDTHRYIVLTQPIRAGQNTIELRVNEKNPSSNSYIVAVFGASLQ